MNEPLWRIGLRELLNGLANAPSDADSRSDGPVTFTVNSDSSSPNKAQAHKSTHRTTTPPSDPPWSASNLRAKGKWITLAVIGLLATALICWLIPLSDPSSRGMISGIFLKLAVFFAGVRLAWPQLCYLFRFKIGFAGFILLLIAGIIFVIRPRATVFAWPILVTLAGGLTFLGWISHHLNRFQSRQSSQTAPSNKNPKR